MEYIINPCSGIKIKVTKGQKLKLWILKEDRSLIFAEIQDDSTEFISPGLRLIVMSH